MFKRCSKCKELKPLKCFRMKSHVKSGTNPIKARVNECKDCVQDDHEYLVNKYKKIDINKTASDKFKKISDLKASHKTKGKK